MVNSTFTSESVCAGHPDKICDRISDSILDEALKNDPYSRVAVEALVTKNNVTLAGEVTTSKALSYDTIAREVIRQLGYTKSMFDFNFHSPINVLIHEQSREIAQGVDSEGAGDQGMMFGYAVRESAELMPLPILLAHQLAATIDNVRKNKTLPYLRPDGKTQITLAYKNGKPVGVCHIVLAVPHSPRVKINEVKNDLYKKVVTPVLAKYGYKLPISELVVNGTGVWHYGGPAADTGVTGRKIVVDTYGGAARVGGGCFSGKDPTKVDRSGAYAARYLAKNIVAAGLADMCEVRLAYFIGAKKPIMQEAETFDTAKVAPRVIADFMKKLLDTSVRGIIEGLNLRQPIYASTSAYGHFGRDGFPWEQVAGV